MTGEADELDEYAVAARTSRRRVIVVVSILVVLVVAAIAWRRATGLPGLDRDTEKEIREALPEIEKLPIEVRRQFAAMAIAELEPKRLPTALVDAFDDYAGAPPEYGGLLLLEPFAEDTATREAWELACPAGLGAIADGAAEGPRATFVRCDLARFNLLTEQELAGASLGELVACHAAWAWLVEHHADSELERRLFRMLIAGR